MTPEPNDASIVSRFVFENPYPLAGVLAVSAVGLFWMGMRDGRRNLMYVAGLLLAIGIIVLTLGMVVVTPAERGAAVVRDLVSAVEANDSDRALGMIADDASFTIGSPRNPGMGIDYIRDQLRLLADRHRIRSIRITSLSSRTESPARAEVQLHCRADVETHFGTTGPTPSEWILRVEEQPDGSWKVTRITAVSISGRVPTNRLW